MYSPTTKVVIWYQDAYDRTWSHMTIWKEFRTTAIDILEHVVDKDVQLFYTVDNVTYELDYYNTKL